MMDEIIKVIRQTKSEIGDKEIECEQSEHKVEDVFEYKITKPFIQKIQKMVIYIIFQE